VVFVAAHPRLLLRSILLSTGIPAVRA
jgi:hypothetical protein